MHVASAEWISVMDLDQVLIWAIKNYTSYHIPLISKVTFFVHVASAEWISVIDIHLDAHLMVNLSRALTPSSNNNVSSELVPSPIEIILDRGLKIHLDLHHQSLLGLPNFTYQEIYLSCVHVSIFHTIDLRQKISQPLI